VFKTRAQQLD